jgi:hypothetical protein
MKNRDIKNRTDFDIQIEHENQPVFVAKGSVNIGYDGAGNLQVIDISIGEAGFQWPDFECYLLNNYLNDLETFCKE